MSQRFEKNKQAVPLEKKRRKQIKKSIFVEPLLPFECWSTGKYSNK